MTESEGYEIVKAMDNETSDINIQNETMRSTRYCCHGDTMIDVDKEQQRILHTEEPFINERKYSANFCCFNDKYHISNHKNYQNKSIFNFNTETQTDCTDQHFNPEDTRLKICRYSYIPSEYYPNRNMQRDCCLIPKRAARLFENSVPAKVHQRREIERSGSNGFQKNITSAFATEVDGYSSKLKYCDRCGNFDGKGSSTSTIQKCTMSKASIFVESGGSMVDLHDFSLASARCKIDMHPAQHGRTMVLVEERDERPNKSNSEKTADTWRSHAREIARASRSDQFSWEKTKDFVRGMDSKWKRDSIEIDAQQSDYKWESRIATVDSSVGARTNMDFKEQRDPTRSQAKNVKANANDKYREARDYFSWTSLQIGRICSQIHDACKNIIKFVIASSIAKDVPKSGHVPGDFVEIGEETLGENSKTPFTDKIYGETCHKNLMHLNGTKRSALRQECVTVDVEKHRATERSMQQKGKEIEDTYIFYGEHGHDGYRKVPEVLLSHATYPNSFKENGQNKNVYPQSSSSESFTYLKVPLCTELRNRGGSDGNQDPAKNTEDKRKSMQYTRNVEETKVVGCHQNSSTIKCTRNISDGELREHQIQCSQQTAPTVCHTPSFTTHACDSQVIYVDASDILPDNSSHRECQLVNSFLLEDSIDMETNVRSITQAESSVKVKAYYKNIDDAAETEKRNLRLETAEIVFVRASSVEINKPDDEFTASTSKCNTPLAPSENDTRSSRYAAAMKFWRKRSAVISNKINSPLFRRRKNAKGNESSNTHNDGMKITQVEPPTTVQTTQESDKGHSDVNVQMQTFDTIVTRILSEFLVSGQKKKKVLMTITLESQSDSDVSHKETQTSSSNDVITPVVIEPFDYTDKGIPHTMMTSSRIVQCFTCAKKDCYEIKHSDDSITLEEALITEYPETSEFDGSYFAKVKSDVEIFR